MTQRLLVPLACIRSRGGARELLDAAGRAHLLLIPRISLVLARGGCRMGQL